MRQFKILLVPLALFAVVFALDKVFLLPIVRENFVSWKKIEPPFYEARRDLYDLYKRSYQADKARGKKIGAIFGTSRSAEFNTDGIDQILHDSRTYNFGAPFACPSFFYYWYSQMKADGILPDYVILETDPLLFNERAIDYSLSYSYDSSFVIKHLELGRARGGDPWSARPGFSFDEGETFFLKRLFALYRYPPDLGVYKDNNQDLPLPLPDGTIRIWKGKEFRAELLKWMGSINELKLGGIPNMLSIQLPPEKLKGDAANMAAIHLTGYSPSRTQIAFYRLLTKSLAEKKIQTIVYWPVVSDAFQEKIDDARLPDFVQRARVEQEIKKVDPAGIIQLIYPAELKCRTFVDSVHLSGSCFPELEKILIEKGLPAQKRK